MTHHENINASITINLPDTIYQKEEYIKFNSNDLQGNIGGYFGLFLGVSLLQLGGFQLPSGGTKKRNAKTILRPRL